MDTPETWDDLNEMIRKTVVNGTNLPNAVLNRIQVEAFIDDVVDESVLLKHVRIARRTEPSGELNRLYIDEPVTEDASLTAQENAPSEAQVLYDTKKARSAFQITSDFMEDIKAASPEQARARIAKLFAKAISNDLEQLAIEGDGSISTSVTRSDRLLKLNDGWSEKMTDDLPAAQDIDAAGAGVSKKLFFDMLQAMPSKYKKNKRDYRFVTAPAIAEQWLYNLSQLATAGGDRAIEGLSMKPFGVPILEVPLMPTDQSYGSGITDATELWLVNPKNLVVILQRKVTWEWERKPRADSWEATVHTRSDFIIENENAVVRAKNVSLTGADYS